MKATSARSSVERNSSMTGKARWSHRPPTGMLLRGQVLSGCGRSSVLPEGLLVAASGADGWRLVRRKAPWSSFVERTKSRESDLTRPRAYSRVKGRDEPNRQMSPFSLLFIFVSSPFHHILSTLQHTLSLSLPFPPVIPWPPTPPY